MTISSSLRRRWGRWCGVLAVCCAAGYGAERYWARALFKKELAKAAELPEPELAPTLVQAQELPTISTGPIDPQSKSSWDPQPQWRFEMAGSLKDQARKSAIDSPKPTPIPEAFPLPPRFKKGPPVVGNAVVDPFSIIENKGEFNPIRQPQVETNVAPNNSIQPEELAAKKNRKIVSSTSVTTFSPFTSQPFESRSPRATIEAVSPVESKSPHPASIAGAGNPNEAWPDQTYTPSSQPETAAAAQSSPLDVATPNLLTNARISVPSSGNSSPRGYSPSASPATISPSGTTPPVTGRYILQPIKK